MHYSNTTEMQILGKYVDRKLLWSYYSKTDIVNVSTFMYILNYIFEIIP